MKIASLSRRKRIFISW